VASLSGVLLLVTGQGVSTAGQLGDAIGGHLNVVLGVANIAVLYKIFISQKSDARAELALARESAAVDRLMVLAELASSAEAEVNRCKQGVDRCESQRTQLSIGVQSRVLALNTAGVTGSLFQPNDIERLQFMTLDEKIVEARAELDAALGQFDAVSAETRVVISQVVQHGHESQRFESLFSLKRADSRRRLEQEQATARREALNNVVERLVELAKLGGPIERALRAGEDLIREKGKTLESLSGHSPAPSNPATSGKVKAQREGLEAEIAQEQVTLARLRPQRDAIRRAFEIQLSMARFQDPESEHWLRALFEVQLRGR
jgi:hypothetical protein